MNKENCLFVLIFALAVATFMLIGVDVANNSTFKHCATNGEAELSGAGTIKCEVIKGKA